MKDYEILSKDKIVAIYENKKLEIVDKERVPFLLARTKDLETK